MAFQKVVFQNPAEYRIFKSGIVVNMTFGKIKKSLTEFPRINIADIVVKIRNHSDPFGGEGEAVCV